MFLAFRKMGYLEYLAVDKIGGYFYDMGDLMGVTSDRRTFLDRQIEIGRAPDYDALWQHTTSALELLKIDRAEMRINGRLWTMDAEGEEDGEDKAELRERKKEMIGQGGDMQRGGAESRDRKNEMTGQQGDMNLNHRSSDGRLTIHLPLSTARRTTAPFTWKKTSFATP